MGNQSDGFGGLALFVFNHAAKKISGHGDRIPKRYPGPSIEELI